MRPSRQTVMTEKQEVFALMASGYMLRVPHDGSPAQLIDGFAIRFKRSPRVSHEISAEQATRLIEAGFISKLTAYGEGDRLGWRAGGLDGDKADWWVPTQ